MTSDKLNANDSPRATAKLYEKYDLNRKYDHPANIDAENSFFGDGKYPPDWAAKRTDISSPMGGRRDAVLEQQRGTCARCRTDLTAAGYYNCHHYRPISAGGKHELNNLVALCGPCHKLIHPDVDELDADWHDAPLFPAVNADPRMATVRRPVTADEQQRYLPELLFVTELSPVGENEFATSKATIPLSPGDALRAAENFDQLVSDMGLDLSTEYVIRVTDSEHRPLQYATVEVEATDQRIPFSKMTDDQGEVSFQLPTGVIVRTTAAKQAFKSAKVTHTTEAGIHVHKFTLQSSQPTPSPSVAPAVADQPKAHGRRSVLKTLGAAGFLFGAGYGVRGLGSKETKATTEHAPVQHSGVSSSPPTTKKSGGSVGFEEAWSYALETYEPIGTSESDESNVYLGMESGLLVGLSSSGDEAWSLDFGEQLTGDLKSSSDHLAVTTSSSVNVVDKRTGTVAWKTELNDEDPETAEIVMSDDVLVIAEKGDSHSGLLSAYSMQSGATLWTLELDDLPRLPQILGSELVFRDDDALLYIENTQYAGKKTPMKFTGTEDYTPQTVMAVNDSLGYYLSRGRAYFSGFRLNAVDFSRKAHVWQHLLSDNLADWDSQYGDLNLAVSQQRVMTLSFMGIQATDYAGNHAWIDTESGGDSLPPVILDDRIYYSTNYGVVGKRISDGQTTHRIETDHELTSLSLSNSNVVITMDNGEVRMLSPL